MERPSFRPAVTTLWTIGHSTHTAGDFVGLLQAHGIELVADVRRFPGSRRHPQFTGPALAQTLAQAGIDYLWLEKLGGRRREPPLPQHLGWRNPSFRSYAAYTWSEPFAEGLGELLVLGNAKRTAMMCSELLWWRCHRALVADVLRFLGVEVIHILGRDEVKVHPYTSPARVEGGELSYPPQSCC